RCSRGERPATAGGSRRAARDVDARAREHHAGRADRRRARGTMGRRRGRERMRLIWRTLRGLMPLLPGRARQFLTGYVVASSSLALLDILALGLLALSLAPMVQGDPVVLPLVGEVAPSGYVGIVAAVSLLIILKGLAAVLVQWMVTRRFARYELEIGDRLFDAYIRAPWTDRLSRNSSQLVRLADVGIANATAGFLLPVAGLPALGATFLAVLVVLVVAQPVTAALT